MPEHELRLADLLAALSLTTDLAMGSPPEKAIRACLAATEAARHLGVPETEVADVYYTTLLKHLGCTATSHEETTFFGPDEHAVRRVAEPADFVRTREMLTVMRATGTGAGIGRVRYLGRAMTMGKEANASIPRAICEVAARLAERLRLGDAVRDGLFQSLERWDGKGEPRGLMGEDIVLPARFAEPATQAVLFHRSGGVDAVMEMLERRSGSWFDPAVAEALRKVAPDVLGRSEDPWIAVLEVEPQPARRIPEGRLDEVAGAFADMIDLKTTFTPGHSPGVAGLAAEAAERLGLASGPVRRAALLHDLGRAAVPNGIWEKPGPLTTTEWEQVRLHPYQTERILARSEALAPLARMAGMHHERQDGSGYHRGARRSEVTAEARLIAAADTYQAMTQVRPHRPARSSEEAAEAVAAEASAGHLDPECARAVIEAAGHRPGPRSSWPAGLSGREVEVLRLVAGGLANKEIARRLSISPRTAEHHVQHIYTKIGTSTRASAALFAVENGLL